MSKFDKMFEKNYYSDSNRITSGFGVDRGTYVHNGLDFSGGKKEEIINLFSGTVEDIDYFEKSWGYRVLVKSNPKFSGGVNENIYTNYAHTSKINVSKDDFVKYGLALGNIGNSGNCLTGWSKDGKTYTGELRTITTEERHDPNCNFGAHLHYDISQYCEKGKFTGLFKQLEKLKLLNKNTVGISHIWQSGKIFYAPRIIIKYFENLNFDLEENNKLCLFKISN